MTRPSESVGAQWCNPLTLQPERSSVVGSIPGRNSLLESHDKKGSRTRLALRLKTTTSPSQLHLHS